MHPVHLVRRSCGRSSEVKGAMTLFLSLLACAPTHEDVVYRLGTDGKVYPPAADTMFRQLEPLAPTSAATVDVPGAPAACRATFSVRVPDTPCQGELPGAETSDIGVRHVPGSLGGVDGACYLVCLPTHGAEWAFTVPAPGWRGSATCAVPSAGTMTIRAADARAGGTIDDAVGARWLTTEGGGAWGLVAVELPDGAFGRWISKHGCPSGQPTRAVSPPD